MAMDRDNIMMALEIAMETAMAMHIRIRGIMRIIMGMEMAIPMGICSNSTSIRKDDHLKHSNSNRMGIRLICNSNYFVKGIRD